MKHILHDNRSECSELRRQPSNANLHHLVLLHIYIDRGEEVTDLLDVGGVVRHRHLSLSNFAQHLSELKLCGCGVRGENLFQISQNVPKKLIAHVGCKAVENFAFLLILGREISVCRLRRCIISSFDITPVTVPEQVLVHLLRARCVVARIELFCRRWGSHSSVNIPIFSFPKPRTCLYLVHLLLCLL